MSLRRAPAALLFFSVVACQTAPPPTLTTASTPPATLPGEQARREHLNSVWTIVKENYYRSDFGGVDWDRARAEIEPRVISATTEAEYRAALAAMVQRLGDGHSVYLGPAQALAEDLAMTGAGRYGGIGFIGGWSDGLYVHAVFAGDAAERAGLRRRDRILAIDGSPPADIQTALAAIRGPEGTRVRLTVRSPTEAPREMTLIRAQVQGRAHPQAVRLEIDPRIGYLFVPTFGVADIGRLAHQELEKVAGPDLSALIIDLRGNPGGEDVAVVEFLGAFVMGDVLTHIGPKHRDVLSVRERSLFTRLAGVPIAVLVDRGTASYAESVAAVLQSLRNAQIVGESTQGNTEFIKPFNLPDGSRLWVAFAIGHLPDGSVVERVVPDVPVDGGWIDRAERDDRYIRQALAVLKSGR